MSFSKDSGWILMCISPHFSNFKKMNEILNFLCNSFTIINVYKRINIASVWKNEIVLHRKTKLIFIWTDQLTESN